MMWKILLTVGIVGGLNGLLALLLVLADAVFANYGECVITINEQKKLSVTGGSTLLTTLNLQKIFLPSACGGRGTCAYCKCKIIEGAGPILPTETSLLDQYEISEQVRLSCQVKVKNDLKIQIPEELFNIKEFVAETVLVESLTYDIKLLRLRLAEPSTLRFKPGQYIQLYNNPYDDVKEVVSRAYSIASSREQMETIDLIIRLIPEGLLTTWVHRFLQSGEKVKFTGPMGEFCYHDGEGEIIMVAGGSGMAPMVSLLEQFSAEHTNRKITYLFGAVSKRDLFYLDQMKKYEESLPNFTFVPALSQPAEDDHWDGVTGLITEPLENHLRQSDTESAQAYLCGSPGMIKACIDVFHQNNVTDDRIFFDPFA